MRGTAPAQSLLWATDALCEDLIEDEGFLATLGRTKGVVFTDADFDPLYPSTRGRPSHPPSTMAALLLAQLFHGVSDREAERRSRLDLSWKAMLGLPLDHRGIPHACLAEFRARLLRAGMEEFLHRKLLRVATEAGVIGGRRVVDSTGIADSVMTQDTVTLIRQALRRCLGRFEELDPAQEGELRRRLARDDYDRQGKPQILWADPAARQQLLGELFRDAALVVEACAGRDDAELERARLLLATVSGQDLVAEPADDGEPTVRLRQGVAADRIVSVVDPDARHGHRSRADRYDGYKLHLSVDVDSDLITAVEATKATHPDAAVLEALLDADPAVVAEVIADTAYGDGATRQTMACRAVELVAPAPPACGPRGTFRKQEFVIDLEADTATCPAGHTVSARRHTRRRNPGAHLQFRFPAPTCSACPLRSRCTSSPGGRIVTIGPHEALLQRGRAERATPAFLERYRERARVERKVAQVKCRSAKLPWRGLDKVRAWIRLRTAALNLDRLGRLGHLRPA